VVGVAENGTEDGEGGGVVEDCAEGNSGGLDWWEVVKRHDCVCVRFFENFDGWFVENLNGSHFEGVVDEWKRKRTQKCLYDG